MSWPSASSNSDSASNHHYTSVTEQEQWDARNPGRSADEDEWFGAFCIPRNGPVPDVPDWLAVSDQGPWARAEESGEGQIQKCICCVEATDELRELGCGHKWDRSCLSAAIEYALQWEGNWPAKCCQNIDDVEMRGLAPFLGDDVVRRFLGKYEEMDTSRDQRIYCANAHCSVFLGQRSTGVHLDSCIKCNTSTCLSCSNEEKLHDHDECPSTTTTSPHEELIRAGKLQQCPGCNDVVELREACNHITCLCGTEFCFSCGAYWRTCFCILYPGGEHESEEAEENERPAEAEDRVAAAQATCPHPIVNNARRRARCEYCGHRSAHQMYKCARCRTAVCWDCYERLNMYAIGASALRQEATLMRANMDREDELGD